MSSPADAVRACWRDIAGDDARGDGAADQILARHAEPHRRYHTAEHVRWVLRHIDAILAVEPPPFGQTVDREALRAAALFHDIVYDPRSATNEADSADIAVATLSAVGWTDDRCHRVHALVLSTASHEANDFETGVLLDADLAVLGATGVDYRAYADGVRFEYGFVDDADWKQGRSEVLRSFLDRSRIYVTATMSAAREGQARANIGAELDALVSDESR